ncbi:MAG: glycine zipper 2TM domain-containing protein [Pirellulaceae bacterium]|nr:glycine zipper 2TM domain-containing protein [Pirellulaceae bacterium]
MFAVVKRFVLALLLVTFFVADADAQFNKHRRRGTIIGGVAGAAIGAAIADRNDNEAVGAVIGGATGAVIGRSIGAQKDHRIESSHHYSAGHPGYAQPGQTYPQPMPRGYRQPVYPHPAPIVVPAHPGVAVQPMGPGIPAGAPGAIAPPISPNDVMAMLQSGISEALVIAQIRRSGTSQPLSVGDIIRLYEFGVSEQLIEVMQASVVTVVPVATMPHTSYQNPIPSAAETPASAQGTSILVPSENRVDLNAAN